MSSIEVKKVDVFTTKPFGGNPAGVVTDAAALSREDMLQIAGLMSLSECVFVNDSPTSKYPFRLRFFTQTTELDMSGHCFIAACFALLEEGKIPVNNGVTILSLETNIGGVPLEIHFEEGGTARDNEAGDDCGVPLRIGGEKSGILRQIMVNQTRTPYRQADIPVGELAAILGIPESEITDMGLPLEIASHGLEQLVIPVMHQKTLLEMQPDLIKLNLLNAKYGIQTNDIFTTEAIHADCSVYSRHFSPAIGLWEDPGSGNGAGSIAVYIVRHGIVEANQMIVETGKDVNSLVRVFVEVGNPSGDKIPVSIGGLAVTSIVQHVELGGEKSVSLSEQPT